MSTVDTISKSYRDRKERHKTIAVMSLPVAVIGILGLASIVAIGYEDEKYGGRQCREADRELSRAFRDAIKGGHQPAIDAVLTTVNRAEDGKIFDVKCRLPEARYQMGLFGYGHYVPDF